MGHNAVVFYVDIHRSQSLGSGLHRLGELIVRDRVARLEEVEGTIELKPRHLNFTVADLIRQAGGEERDASVAKCVLGGGDAVSYEGPVDGVLVSLCLAGKYEPLVSAGGGESPARGGRGGGRRAEDR